MKMAKEDVVVRLPVDVHAHARLDEIEKKLDKLIKYVIGD